MKRSSQTDLSQLSMLELFNVEAENQTATLTAGLLECERSEAEPKLLESLMRAAHSLKGAARIVNLACAVRVAHAMEDCFVAAQQGRLRLKRAQIDTLLAGVDLLEKIAKCDAGDLSTWERDHAEVLEGFVAAAQAMVMGELSAAVPVSKAADANIELGSQPENSTRIIRLSADTLNRLLGLAGESLVETRWLRPFSESMQRLKRMQTDLADAVNGLRQQLTDEELREPVKMRLNEAVEQARATRDFLSNRLEELDLYDRRSGHLSNRLYLEVLRTRMRPFGDGVQGFPRMVRDLANSLGKQVRLEIAGEHTQVDRDILEKLETPLTHLLRNAVDHGCEIPESRAAAGKPTEALILLEARHSAGMLLVTVTDDGAGVDVTTLRQAIVDKQLTTAKGAERMGEAELLEFLFLPGFSMKDTVTEISGRGVGLDVVHDMVKQVRGTVRVATQAGRGMKFQLQLPLTLSVLRALLFEVAGEPYAIPLAQITHTLKLTHEQVETVEGRAHFAFGGRRVALLSAGQVLDAQSPRRPAGDLPVVVLGERQACFGLIVDRFLGERELVVQSLDPRLGKIQDISAAAVMEDGSPVLIVDVDDLLHSIEKLIVAGTLDAVPEDAWTLPGCRKKRVLAVDDSLTVRELERKLLTSRGYLADVAVDGLDAWNAVRTASYDLVITDVDMPRMDGIELATLIKQDAQLKTVPVLIVSYKDREADRLRGLEAGADYYLTKGSFHDETLLHAVRDLIGEPEA